MDQIEAIESAAKLLLEKAQNATVSELATAVEKVSAALRLSADLEKSRAESRKLALEESKLRYEIDSAPKLERSERLKEYVSLLGPIVAIITLATTLFLQRWQFMQSEKDKREAAENALWAQAESTLSNPHPTVFDAEKLIPFLELPRYRDRSRRYAIRLILRSSDPDLFDGLFSARFPSVDSEDLDEVLTLDRALLARGQHLWQKTYDPKTETNDYTKLTSDQKKIADYVEGALIKICPQVASVLRARRPRGATLDLSGAQLSHCDCSGVDLSGTNISGASMIWVDLKGANLANITQFGGAYFHHVAWWEAANISPKLLLDYLEKDAHSRYKEDWTYGPRQDRFTQQQYRAALDRLKQQAP